MREKDVESIIKQIARANHTTPEHVRKEMEVAMELVMANPNPSVQSKWSSIPRKGNNPTLEEFIWFIAESTSN